MSCQNRSCPFFEDSLDGATVADLKLHCAIHDSLHNVSFRQGEVLFLQGQPSTTMYSLTQGVVKICANTSDGREQIVGLSAPGNLLVGLQSLNEPRHAYSAIAVTPVLACRTNHGVLLEHAQKNSEVAMRLIQAANAQLAHSRALMEALGQKKAAAKIASFILLMVPRAEHGNCGFAMPFSRGEMGSILGLSEETVCRLMAQMKRAGAIYAPRGKVEIRNWHQLQAISDGSARIDSAA